MSSEIRTDTHAYNLQAKLEEARSSLDKASGQLVLASVGVRQVTGMGAMFPGDSPDRRARS